MQLETSASSYLYSAVLLSLWSALGNHRAQRATGEVPLRPRRTTAASRNKVPRLRRVAAITVNLLPTAALSGWGANMEGLDNNGNSGRLQRLDQGSQAMLTALISCGSYNSQNFPFSVA